MSKQKTLGGSFSLFGKGSVSLAMAMLPGAS